MSRASIPCRQPGRTTLLLLLAAIGGLALSGCKSNPEEPDDVDPAITEVSLEAPTAASTFNPQASGSRQAELAALRAENQALSGELERMQSKNRAFAMETARLREEVLSRPLPTMSGGSSPAVVASAAPAAPPPPPPASSSGASFAGAGSVPEGVYTVQAASYRSNSKGEAAAAKLVSFFESQGFTPTSYRPSGSYLIVLVGAYGSKSEAKAARSEIAGLAYHGRKGDFKTATVRKN